MLVPMRNEKKKKWSSVKRVFMMKAYTWKFEVESDVKSISLSVTPSVTYLFIHSISMCRGLFMEYCQTNTVSN